jgi:hypothetical protein
MRNLADPESVEFIRMRQTESSCLNRFEPVTIAVVKRVAAAIHVTKSVGDADFNLRNRSHFNSTVRR